MDLATYISGDHDVSNKVLKYTVFTAIPLSPIKILGRGRRGSGAIPVNTAGQSKCRNAPSAYFGLIRHLNFARCRLSLNSDHCKIITFAKELPFSVLVLLFC